MIDRLNARTFILSQDYELFVHRSGSVERCLYAPSDLLSDFAASKGIPLTFFVDAGMLVKMQELAGKSREIARQHTHICRHLESLHSRGHELALHVHPHWQDTRLENEQWSFGQTRYSVKEFSDQETVAIFREYAESLANIAGEMPTSYRAGGFCVEPWQRVRAALEDIGIFTDSSVVNGALLRDPVKGFDFRSAPQKPFWFFEDSPYKEDVNGRFCEIAIQPVKISRFYYWRRLWRRLKGREAHGVYGDGQSMAIGPAEVIIRLAGLSRIVELSIDGPKSEFLSRATRHPFSKNVVHAIGHPKLLSERSLIALEAFLGQVKFSHFETVSSFARKIRSEVS
jgi:hypothetical protein